MSDHSQYFLYSIKRCAEFINPFQIEEMVTELIALRERKGRLFFIGLGGSAANGSHAVNDFRKLCNVESYAPTDNVAELTARINDEGWKSVFSHWLHASCLSAKDAIFILSVGGGSAEISPNISHAIDYAKAAKATVFGIVGRDGGYTAQHGDHIILVPNVNETLVTPITESFQSILLHCLVSHPDLAQSKAKWESIS